MGFYRFRTFYIHNSLHIRVRSLVRRVRVFTSHPPVVRLSNPGSLAQSRFHGHLARYILLDAFDIRQNTRRKRKTGKLIELFRDLEPHQETQIPLIPTIVPCFPIANPCVYPLDLSNFYSTYPSTSAIFQVHRNSLTRPPIIRHRHHESMALIIHASHDGLFSSYTS